MTPLAPESAGSNPPRTPVLTWRHAIFAVILGVDLTYGAIILSGVAIAGHERLLPPQVNQVIVGALAATTVIACCLVIAARITERIDESVVIVGGVAAAVSNELEHVKVAISALAGEISRIRERPGRRLGDETTVPLNGHVQGRAYASASMFSGGRIDSIAEAQQGLYAAVARIGMELGQVRQLVDQRAGAGAPRRRRPKGSPSAPGQRANGDPANGFVDDAELRGYLTRVYDQERGTDQK